MYPVLQKVHELNTSINKVSQSLWDSYYKGANNTLCREHALSFTEHLVRLIFPQRDIKRPQSAEELQSEIETAHRELVALLECLGQFTSQKAAIDVATSFFDKLPDLAAKAHADAKFLATEDPAANSVDEVILSYPGVYAVTVYRCAHELHNEGVPTLPRLMTELANSKTGIEIHPGAKIGVPFFIDHGTGVVIGQTTEIGNRVKIFQGVTLGALSVERELRNTKRHPTIEDDCLIYSNTTILGGETIIGANSVIGGNVWLTKSIPPNSRIFHTPD